MIGPHSQGRMCRKASAPREETEEVDALELGSQKGNYCIVTYKWSTTSLAIGLVMTGIGTN